MLPEPLARERDRVEVSTFMGLLPEIEHAWMTVDNVLYLWNFRTGDFTQYRDLEQVGLLCGLTALRSCKHSRVYYRVVPLVCNV